MFNRYLNGLQIRVFIIVTFTAIFWLLLFCYNRLLICFHDNYRRHDDYGCFRHHVCHFYCILFLHWQWAFWCDLHWHCISWIFAVVLAKVQLNLVQNILLIIYLLFAGIYLDHFLQVLFRFVQLQHLIDL